MSFPSGAIWNCRSGFGICFRHTTTFKATAGAWEPRTIFQRSPCIGRRTERFRKIQNPAGRFAGPMRTAAFAIIAAAVVVVAAVTAAAVLRPTSYLYSPPRVDARCEDAYVPRCEDAYVLRAAGTLAWLTLEGGMWEFETNGKLDGLYDLYGVPGFLPADRIA